jgi:ribose/xylose/arabinose/galactoside ABC-type transport system permease subunit
MDRQVGRPGSSVPSPAGGTTELVAEPARPDGSARSGGSPMSGVLRLIRDNGILVALLVLVIVGTIIEPTFLTPGNLANVARQAAIVGILGIGMTFVILTAGIDLSVGSILGFSAIAFATAMTSGVPWPLAMLLAIAAGGAVGALNGLGITRGRLQPFVMTLGMLVIARGVTMTWAQGKPIGLRELGRDIAWLGDGSVAGVPVPVIVLGVLAAVAWFVLRHTPFGREVYAVGDNPEAARLSGIATSRVIFSVYVISGVCAAISALIVVSRLTAGEPSQGTGVELDAIAIVVIGGTSLFGGEGGVGGTLIGAAIVAAMNNLLNLIGVSPFSQQIVKGLIILGAVFLERRSAARREGR